LSNILTSIGVTRLSKKDLKKTQQKLDSIKLLKIQVDIKLRKEVVLRRKIFLEDSLLTIQYTKQRKTDSLLILKQRRQLGKFKNLPASVNLSKLDSAYEAENN